MKAEELLMVGDWFRFRYTIDGREKVKTFRISQIENELGKYYVWGNGFGRMCHPDRLEPIPLTPEILEKNGFEKRRGGEFAYDDDDENLFMVYYPKSMNYNGIYNFIDISRGCVEIKELPIQYVHELQHCFKLSGIDKTIEL